MERRYNKHAYIIQLKIKICLGVKNTRRINIPRNIHSALKSCSSLYTLVRIPTYININKTIKGININFILGYYGFCFDELSDVSCFS